jgi:CBS domain-containing protein/transcriptional regulator with XRE-family HTH domain
MKHNKVGSVMTSDVIRAEYATPFKEVARLLADGRISGLPVVDDDEKVIGVISETDLVTRQAEALDTDEPKRRFAPAESTSAGRRRAAKSRAFTAGQLMTEPPVTVHADETIAQAARIMAQRHVERLPVLDEENRLVGIVTRRDLLRVFLRPDAEIRDEVIGEVLVRALRLAPWTIDVSVAEGVVTLAGRLERKSETELAVSLTKQIDGVVAVIDQLTHRSDDSRLPPDERSRHGIADDWLRNPRDPRDPRDPREEMRTMSAQSSSNPVRGLATGDLGRRIALRREELGLTREETAHRAGMASSYVQHLEEQPTANPGAAALLRLAGALETTVRELTGGDVDLPPGLGQAGRHPKFTELSPQECRDLLSTHGVGRLAVPTPSGPLILPVNYSVVESVIAFRTHPGTALAQAMGCQVAFEVDHIDEALSQGWSVLVRGPASAVMDPDCVQLLKERAYSEPWAGGRRDMWIRINPLTVTGRRIAV